MTRCELTELLVENCDHCWAKANPFPAQFAGHCPTCDQAIKVGDKIRERADGQYEHGRHR